MMRGVEPLSENFKPIAVSILQVAKLMNIGETMAWELVRSGVLPSVRIGRRRLVLISELERLAARLAEGEDVIPM
jgi:excisionase family DNA binding protein